jgi:hypothetical protein
MAAFFNDLVNLKPGLIPPVKQGVLLPLMGKCLEALGNHQIPEQGAALVISIDSQRFAVSSEMPLSLAMEV